MVPLVQPQAGRTARGTGGLNPRTGRVVFVAVEGDEFVFPARAEKYLLGKLANFHISILPPSLA